MIRANAGGSIICVLGDKHMARLGMQHTVEEFPTDHDTGSDARTHSKIHDDIKALCSAKRHFAKASGVDVGIVSHRYGQSLKKSPTKIVVLPTGLRGIKHTSEVRGIGIDAGRPEGTDAQCTDVTVGKP